MSEKFCIGTSKLFYHKLKTAENVNMALVFMFYVLLGIYVTADGSVMLAIFSGE